MTIFEARACAHSSDVTRASEGEPKRSLKAFCRRHRYAAALVTFTQLRPPVGDFRACSRMQTRSPWFLLNAHAGKAQQRLAPGSPEQFSCPQKTRKSPLWFWHIAVFLAVMRVSRNRIPFQLWRLPSAQVARACRVTCLLCPRPGPAFAGAAGATVTRSSSRRRPSTSATVPQRRVSHAGRRSGWICAPQRDAYPSPPVFMPLRE